MKTIIFLRICVLSIFYALVFQETYAQKEDKIKLPIEIFGSVATTKKITFSLQKAAEIKRLFLKIHRPSYRNHNDIPSKQPKLSIKVNNGKWIDITDETCDVYQPEKSYGGIAGGYHTVRLTCKVSGFVNGTNTLSFRFNGTDGVSTGLRIVSINLKKDGFVNLWNGSNFERENPAIWKAPLTNATDIAAGKNLWYNKQLRESSINTKNINAKCTSCHAQDGRDLKYFNYSNYSIIERSKFHGLSDKEGKQIASYIRSLNTPAPKQARPYNPPYQPGPGLDSKPVEEWAAGAGLDWVLEKDEDMLSHLFPYGTSQTGLARSIDYEKTLNIREIPIAIQFPDWNSWLPATHPLDIWTPTFYKSNADYTNYQKARKSLLEEGVDQLIENNKLVKEIDLLEKGAKDFINKNSTNTGGKWRVADGDAVNNIVNGYSFAEAKLQIAKLVALRSWELVQEFDIEDKSQKIYGDLGEKRSWPFQSRSVFNVAPHIVADNLNNFPDQDPMIGDFFSTSWYQLQMTINAANRQPASESPVDWPYQQRHIQQLGDYDNTPHNPLRFILTQIKAYQARTNANGSNRSGFELRITHPWWFYSNSGGDTSMLDALDAIKPNLRNAIVETFLKDFLRIVQHHPNDSYRPENWARIGHESNSTARWAKVEPDDYIPVPYSGTGKLFEFPENYHADNFFRLIPKLKENGIDQQIINDLADWCATMWPKGNWKSFKENLSSRSPLGKTIVLKALNVQKYISMDNNSGSLLANKSTLEEAEYFRVQDAGNGYIALKSLRTNKFVRINKNISRNPMVVSGDKIGDWMKINWIPNQDGSISLKSLNTKLFARADKNNEDTPILVEGEKVGTWMRFNFEIVPDINLDITSTKWILKNKDSDLWIRPIQRSHNTDESSPLVLTKQEHTLDYVRFSLIPTQNGYFFIQNSATNGRFRPKDCSDKTGDSIEIVQVGQEFSGLCVQWKLIDAGNGYYRIENRKTGHWIRNYNCEDADNDTVSIVQTSKKSIGDCTKWKLLSPKEAVSAKDSNILSDLETVLFPNPATTVTSISNPNITKAEIISLSGRKIKEIVMTSDANDIYLDDINAGLYIIKMYETDKLIKISKLIVQKK